jgi:MFS transporter, SP family, general alpha glucoside:H+ symporter
MDENRATTTGAGPGDEKRALGIEAAGPNDEDVMGDAGDKSSDEVIRGAKAATDKERRMTLWQGVKLYPKAIGWSMLISTCIAMEGYDISLVNNFCKVACLLAEDA